MPTQETKPIDYTDLMTGLLVLLAVLLLPGLAMAQTTVAPTHSDQAEGLTNERIGWTPVLVKQSKRAQSTAATRDKDGQVCNIVAYGATADDKTDDTAAITAAASACNGGTVFMPLGTFIGGNIVLGSNIVLRGADVEKTILKRKDGSRNVFLLANGNNIQFRDFTIDGNQAKCPSASEELALGGGADNVVENVKIKNWRTNGITPGLHSRIENVELIGTPSVSQYGIWMAFDMGIFDYTTISNTTVRRTRQAGMYLGGKNIRVINPTLIDCHHESRPSGGGQLAAGATGTFEIVGGFIGGATPNTSTTGIATTGIEVDNGAWTIVGTEIAHQSNYGIFIQGPNPANHVIRDVRIYNSGTDGIQAAAGLSGFSISGKVCAPMVLARSLTAAVARIKPSRGACPQKSIR
jgi:hypothetical protein